MILGFRKFSKLVNSREWHDFIPPPPTRITKSIHIDLGAGSNPRNPFDCHHLIATDINIIKGNAPNIHYVKVDLTSILPFESDSIFSFSAYDVLEHIPRWERKLNGDIVFPFVNLMSEIFRCLAPGGLFMAVTPAFPAQSAFQDPTHVNFISIDTIKYFSGKNPWCKDLGYGFINGFNVIKNEWLLGNAPYNFTSKLEFMQRYQRLIPQIRLILKNNIFIKGFYRFSRRLSFFEKSTHLLWVLQKPYLEE